MHFLFETHYIENQKKEAADNQFLCPITYEKLRKPVMAEDGFVYELETINQLKAQSESNDSFKSPIRTSLIIFHAIKLNLKLWKIQREINTGSLLS